MADARSGLAARFLGAARRWINFDPTWASRFALGREPPQPAVSLFTSASPPLISLSRLQCPLSNIRIPSLSLGRRSGQAGV